MRVNFKSDLKCPLTFGCLLSTVVRGIMHHRVQKYPRAGPACPLRQVSAGAVGFSRLWVPPLLRSAGECSSDQGPEHVGSPV